MDLRELSRILDSTKSSKDDIWNIIRKTVRASVDGTIEFEEDDYKLSLYKNGNYRGYIALIERRGELYLYYKSMYAGETSFEIEEDELQNDVAKAVRFLLR